jgi:hypothetical protein
MPPKEYAYMQEHVRKRRTQRSSEGEFPEQVRGKVFYNYGDVVYATSRLENEGYKCAIIRSTVLGAKDFKETVTIGGNPVWFKYIDLGDKAEYYFLCLKPGEKVGVDITGTSFIGGTSEYSEKWEFENIDGEIIGRQIAARY